MILSAQSIRRRYRLQPHQSQHLGITPFQESMSAFGMSYGLGPAGYDVRIGHVHNKKDAVQVSHSLEPGDFHLVSVREHLIVPTDLMPMIKDKSTWARRGLCVQNTVAEPGWRGFLTLELTNHGKETILLMTGMPIAQLVFAQLDQHTDRPYEGKYQDQPEDPTEAIHHHD